MSDELKKLKAAIEWAKGIKKNKDSFTAGTNNAADVILKLINIDTTEAK